MADSDDSDILITQCFDALSIKREFSPGSAPLPSPRRKSASTAEKESREIPAATKARTPVREIRATTPTRTLVREVSATSQPRTLVRETPATSRTRTPDGDRGASAAVPRDRTPAAMGPNAALDRDSTPRWTVVTPRPRSRVRWEEETEDDTFGPVNPFADDSVSAHLFDRRGLGEPTVLGQSRETCPSYIGGSSGITPREPETPRQNSAIFEERLPVNHFPEFDGGNFRCYYFRIKLAFNSYPQSERLHLLRARLSDNVINYLYYAVGERVELMTYQELIDLLLREYNANPPGENRDKTETPVEIYRRMPMAELCPYNGDTEDFDMWYRRAALYLDTYPPEERVQRLCSRLGPKPFEFVQRRDEETLADFGCLLKSLRRQYSSPMSKLRAQELLYAKTQGRETLQEFEGELRRLVRLSFPAMNYSAREDIVLGRMLAGTNNLELSRYFTFNQAVSVEHVLRVADLIRQNRLMTPGEVGSRVVDVDRDCRARAGPYRSADVRRNLSPSRPVTPPQGTRENAEWPRFNQMDRRPTNVSARRPQSPTAQCYECGGYGHFRRDCRFTSSRNLNR